MKNVGVSIRERMRGGILVSAGLITEWVSRGGGGHWFG